MYYVDVLDTPDGLKLLEVMGNTGSIAMARDAGYGNRPVEEFIHRMMNASDREGPIVYLLGDPSVEPNAFPAQIEDLFARLPPSTADIGWRAQYVAFRERIHRANENGWVGTRLKRRLEKTARGMHVDLLIAKPYSRYPHEELLFRRFGDTAFESIPFDNIRYLANGAHDLSTFPRDAVLQPELFEVPHLNDPRTHHLLQLEGQPKWMFEIVLREAGRYDEFAHLFPRTAYTGLGLGTGDEIADIAANSPSGLVAVKKAMSVHHGIGLRYLDQQALDAECRRAERARREILPFLDEIREYILLGVELQEGEWATIGSPITVDTKNGRRMSRLEPVVERGASIVQEFLHAIPVRSAKTGLLHQGTTRAIFFNTTLLAAYHQLAETPYSPGSFQPVTDADERTFLERVSPELEERIADTLSEPLQVFSQAATQHPLHKFAYDIASKNRILALLNR